MMTIAAYRPDGPATCCGDRISGMVEKPSTVHRDPAIQAGVPVFRGTRVPLRNLIEYLEAGDDLDAFLDDFPSVTREQAVAALEEAAGALEAACGSS